MFLVGLSTSYQGSNDRHIARQILDKAEEVSGDNILDRHFTYSAMVPVYYRDRDELADGLAKAIQACENQIALAPQAAKAWRNEYGEDDPLPSHRGFTQLAIIREKEKDFEKAIRLSKQAQEQGWAGDWDKRIERCAKRMAKSKS